jgi:cytochrome o ubiquinol oxidase subunit 1
MSLSMVPMFSWSMLVGGTVWILSLPVLAATLVLIYVDHQYGQKSFGANSEMYERIVWAFRQPQVYAYAVPALGIITDSLLTISGRRLASRPAAMGAIGMAGAVGFGAFLQPTVNPKAVEEPLFVILSVLAILPMLGLFGLWGDLLRRGERRIASPVVFGLAAGLMLLVATLVGATIAVPAFDMTGTTAQFGQSHYALLAATIAAFGGLWLWGSKIFGRRLPEPLGLLAGLLLLVGTVGLSLPDVISGAFGNDQDAVEGIDWLNKVAALGGLVAVLGVLVAVVGLVIGFRSSATSDGEALAADPWGTGATLEWSTASPPEYSNFAEPVVVTSAEPLLDEPTDRNAEGTTR